MSILFSEASIGRLTLKNRFVRSATWEGLAAEDGSCTDRLISLVEKLASNEVGLIISGHAYVEPQGQAGPGQMGIYDDKLIDGLARMTEAVHKAGGKIFVQLAHAGCHGLKARIGPSAVSSESVKNCGEMGRDDIRRVVTAFGRAAKRAVEAGFDGIQIHAAHGYLLSEFLSPFYNHRTDEYGGSPANRARIVIEVLESIREVTGSDYPVCIKINSQDFLEGGLTEQDSLEICSILAEKGIDAIELSGGTPLSGKYTPVRTTREEAWYEGTARKLKELVAVPVILVGGIRSFETAERIVGNGVADFVALSRPLIREPDLVKRWKEGDRRPAQCVSDNLCFRPAMKGEGIYCVTEKRQREKE
ncbi:NADH:flavin oxidoreductase [Thermodesulforhabdus norvegica]|uniref:2,4-dienoyl-CoA reductase n=1 Tax=Thermodesulforhabdus norvegica TaxID=39841 RepID=A0A1I4RKK7_9BACT|nr:NADH:flavin oxidoreductase [Thermodesulforhabdus norvegica]SFM52792.1 2,4-dienoyl-CoA reductase [Thermodesulforhabdus norvegica]